MVKTVQLVNSFLRVSWINWSVKGSTFAVAVCSKERKQNAQHNDRQGGNGRFDGDTKGVGLDHKVCGVWSLPNYLPTFIHHQHSPFPQESTGHAQELPLSNGQVSAVLCNGHRQTVTPTVVIGVLSFKLLVLCWDSSSSGRGGGGGLID